MNHGYLLLVPICHQLSQSVRTEHGPLAVLRGVFRLVVPGLTMCSLCTQGFEGEVATEEGRTLTMEHFEVTGLFLLLFLFMVAISPWESGSNSRR